MDSFFDLLIGFIIVYSLLSPLFKKKKKPDDVETTDYEDEPAYEPVDDKSIADEIAILFGEKPKSETAQRKPVESVDYSSTHPQKKFERKVYSESEKKYSHLEKVKRTLSSDEQKRIDELASKFLSHETGVDAGTNETKNRILTVFHSKENLRDYILFAEVFGKPKALRR